MIGKLKNVVSKLIEENRRLKPLVFSLAILSVLAFAFQGFLFVGPTERLLRQAEFAFSEANYPLSFQFANVALQQSPNSTRAYLVAGQASTAAGRQDIGLQFFDNIPETLRSQSPAAASGRANSLIHLGRVREGQEELERLLDQVPENLAALERLSLLLEVQGRSWEAIPHMLAMLRNGKIEKDLLMLTGSPEIMSYLYQPFYDRCLSAFPEDPGPMMGKVRNWLRYNDWENAELWLKKIVKTRPEIMEAQARLGWLLLKTEKEGEFVAWHQSLPASADKHPLIWFTRGLWAQKTDQLPAAVKCFGQTLRLHPNHVGANYQLARVLAATDKTKLAAHFENRARQLSQVELLIDEMSRQHHSKMEQDLIELLEQLGRHLESAAWRHLALQREPNLVWDYQSPKRWATQALLCNQNTGLINDPTLGLDLTTYPAVVVTPSQVKSSEIVSTDKPFSEIQFRDDATSVGLNFHYDNGSIATSPREYLFEFDGGGIAVMDYDGDAWPDIYLTQGCHWPPGSDSKNQGNRLFRNLGNGQFLDVTQWAAVDDQGFGQGCTYGDFDCDGFPDLYVANVRGNRLYRNNGDGTYTDVTAETQVAGNQWTSSCTMVDLNNDGFPDIYAVNYVGGPDLLGRICRKDSEVRCSPSDFLAEQDRLYLNQGDGTFQEITQQSGIVAEQGQGLGIVAADFDGSGRISLFVANDTTANFFFVNQTQPNSQIPTFNERAIPAGYAFNDDGIAQACMGVAADDANADGLIDLFVTNFYSDSNAFYVGQPGGMAIERVQQAKLRDPGFNKLGFGTQFLDADLDGQPDLIVVNGHIYDFTKKDIPYRMQPQFFRNVGNGRFAEINSENLGTFFERPALGRSAARLDWNRDGLEDICVQHQDQPTALITNTTLQAGNSLAISLCGVLSSRDAIGTTVQVKSSAGVRIRQLTAGDGYQACNQRQLTFGLGTADRVDELKLTWPSGTTQTFNNVPVNKQFRIVEGFNQLFTLLATP